MLLLIFFLKNFFDKVFEIVRYFIPGRKFQKVFLLHTKSGVVNVKVLENSYVMFIGALLLSSSIINLDATS